MAAPCPCAAVAEGPGLRAAAATASDWQAERQPEERGWGLEEGRERGRVRPVWLAGWEGERGRMVVVVDVVASSSSLLCFSSSVCTALPLVVGKIRLLHRYIL